MFVPGGWGMLLPRSGMTGEQRGYGTPTESPKDREGVSPGLVHDQPGAFLAELDMGAPASGLVRVSIRVGILKQLAQVAVRVKVFGVAVEAKSDVREVNLAAVLTERLPVPQLGQCKSAAALSDDIGQYVCGFVVDFELPVWVELAGKIGVCVSKYVAASHRRVSPQPAGSTRFVNFLIQTEIRGIFCQTLAAPIGM